MKPAPRFALGAGLPCALRLLARHALAPVPPTVPLASATSASAKVAQASSLRPQPNKQELPAATDAPASREVLLVRRCLTFAERDPLSAMEMALAENLCATDPGLRANLLLRWAAQDFSAAYEWTESQEGGAWRDDLLARLGYVRAQKDPALRRPHRDTRYLAQPASGRGRDFGAPPMGLARARPSPRLGGHLRRRSLAPPRRPR
jgi:hypothetical protein